jgi:hypothetical protein
MGFSLHHGIALLVVILINHFCHCSGATGLDFTSSHTAKHTESPASVSPKSASFSFDFPAQQTTPAQLKQNQNERTAEEKSDTKRYIVLHLNTLGLANRLRTVADFYTIAVYSGRTLLLSWEPSIDCNTTFTDLFLSGPEHLKVLAATLPHNTTEASNHVQQKARHGQLSYANFDTDKNSGATSDDRYFSYPALFDSAVDVIFTSYWGSTALHHLPCQHFMLSRSKFYQALVPVPAVSRVVEEVKLKFRGKIMVGVHIRGFDWKYDWAVGE